MAEKPGGFDPSQDPNLAKLKENYVPQNDEAHPVASVIREANNIMHNEDLPSHADALMKEEPGMSLPTAIRQLTPSVESQAPVVKKNLWQKTKQVFRLNKLKR